MPSVLTSLVLFCFLPFAHTIEDKIETTKVFVMTLDPKAYNWTSGFSREGYWFRSSLLGGADLPQWLSYVYSHRIKSGFLYGVPPSPPSNYELEIIAVHRRSYEIQNMTVRLNVTEKPDPAKYEVQLKIDNMNIEDMFDAMRLDALMGVFTKVLWPQSAIDLYLTFLDSALNHGARKPLRPNDSDGVVLRVGSRNKFSDDLINLQEEVRPLWKLPSCPRDFKRTTVDRHFRSGGFSLDWCFFRLGNGDKGGDTVNDGGEKHSRRDEIDGTGGWKPVYRNMLSYRSPRSDFLAALLLPIIILLIMVLLLSLILCFHHDRLVDSSSDDFFDSLIFCDEYYWSFRRKGSEENEETLTQYEAVQRATNSLRSLSTVRNPTQRLIGDTSDAGRPNPPPYASVKHNMHHRDS